MGCKRSEVQILSPRLGLSRESPFLLLHGWQFHDPLNPILLTVCFRCKWAGVVSLGTEKLEARKMLVKRGESHLLIAYLLCKRDNLI